MNATRLKCWTTTAAGAAALTLCTTPVMAHDDVEIGYVDGRIVTEGGTPGSLGPIFDDGFPTDGVLARWTDDPGFDTAPDEGLLLGAGDTIDYNVLESPHGFLVFWDADTGNFISTDATITIGNNPRGETVISNTDVTRNGGFIGEADSDGELHAHVDFTLSEDAGIGAYGFLLELTTNNPDYANSDPFWFAFNHGLEHDRFHNDALDAFAAIPEPGSLALLGVGGAVLLMRRRGRN